MLGTTSSVLLFLAACAAAPGADAPFVLGSVRELFLDDHLILRIRLSNARLYAIWSE